jgi:hypothetical protein
MNADELAGALGRTRDFLTRYIVFTYAEQADAVALWCGYTWFYDQWDTAPYLAFQAPARRSGKTRGLECAELLVRAPQMAGGTTAAALVRIVHLQHSTLLLDEADPLLGRRNDPSTEDIRGLLNNGYRRGKPYLKVVGEGKKMHVESFDVFGPKALASIGRLPDTVQDRSIVIELKRRIRSEAIAKFRFNRAALEATPIREWWEALAEQVQLPDEVQVPEQLSDREEDCWEPLIALAAAAGGDWPQRVRGAALKLSGAVEVEDEDYSVLVLSDIRDILGEKPGERIATSSLIEDLHNIEERPWRDDYRHGKPLRAEGLAYLLRRYKIRSRQMKIGGTNVRGYETAWFTDAFERYLSSAQGTPSTLYLATSERESQHEGSEVAGKAGPESACTEANSGVGERTPKLPVGDESGPDPCEVHQCVHRYETDCTLRCETEEQLVEQVTWLRRNAWTTEQGGAHVEQPAGDAA